MHIAAMLLAQPALIAGMHIDSVVSNSRVPFRFAQKLPVRCRLSGTTLQTGADRLRTCWQGTSVCASLVLAYATQLRIQRTMSLQDLSGNTHARPSDRYERCLPWTAVTQHRFSPSVCGFGALAVMVVVCFEL